MKEKVLSVKNLSKTYEEKGEPVKAVDDISFSVNKGEIMGLLGPNGAGKTTTIKMICSLILPDSGQIIVDGFDNFQERGKALSKISAVLEGNRNIYWRLTVRENLEFFAALKGYDPAKLQDKIDYYIKFFNMGEKENTSARHLSRGMQQKLAIAVALITQSKVVLLDEPTLGLDVQASYDLRNLLKEIAEKEKITIIITTHDTNVVQDICERVIIIENGKIIADDKITNLMKVFKVKSYQIKIKGKLSNSQKKLFDNFSNLNYYREADETIIEVNLKNINQFYKVMEILKKNNSEIESIEGQELNFEKVFMEILEGSEPNEKNINAL